MTRLRTCQEVYHRIRWDPALDATTFLIGYAERDGGRVEVPLLEFRPGGRIPWHRVQYVKQGTRIVWDRAARLDLTDALDREPVAAPASPPSGRPGLRWDGTRWSPDHGSSPAAPRVLTAVTWNVLQGRFDPDPQRREPRHALLLARLAALAPDVIALQEVDPELAARLLAAPWVREGYAASAGPDDPGLRPSGQLLLARASLQDVSPLISQDSRRGVLATAAWADRALRVASLHLTSAAAGADAAARRRDEADLLARRLGADDALLLGDLNARAGEPLEQALSAAGLVDVWPALYPDDPGPTFEPEANPLARAHSQSGLPGRLDRALVRAGWLTPRRARRLGRRPAADVWPSDHAGLRVALDVDPPALAAPPSHRSAVCAIPPEATWAPIQAIRAEHDRGYRRWPPHVNLLYGFLPEPEAGLPALRDALRDVPPCELSLARFERFAHRASVTVWLAPEPEAPLRELQGRLEARFPQCDEQGRKSARGFTPHLSVGGARGDARARELAASWARDWTPLRFLLDHVCVLRREGDEAFRMIGRVPLAGPAPAPTLAPLREACAQVADAAGVDAPWVEVVGSHGLGVAADDDDLDVLVVTPHGLSREELFAALPDALGRPGWVGGAIVPSLRLHGPGQAVDVQVAEAPDGVDPAEAVGYPPVDDASRRALAAARDGHALRAALGEAGATARFRTLARALRGWAGARDLRGGAWGLLGGFGWSLLAAWAALDGALDLAAACARIHAWGGAPGLSPIPGPPAALAPAPWQLASPADPTLNVARQVTAATAQVLDRELRAAAQGEPPPDLTALPRLRLLASDPPAWGVVEGALRGLLGQLEAGGIAPRPLPRQRALGLAAGDPAQALQVTRAWAAGLPVEVSLDA